MTMAAFVWSLVMANRAGQGAHFSLLQLEIKPLSPDKTETSVLHGFHTLILHYMNRNVRI